MNERELAALRTDYAQRDLSEAEVFPDPIAQFERWFEEARIAGAHEPNAMTLATADGEGRPSARVALLKGVDARGFTFFTNYESDKARDLAENPRAALVFFWPVLERQVRVEGTVERVDERESEEYFAIRPRASQLGALASPQSRPLPDRAVLERRFAELDESHRDRPVPRPPHWGGYRVRPERIELWQGRRSRLHDRLVYRLGADGVWAISRLAP
jgi:pyridoxamine 5'-phosphate oxidase